MCFMNGICFIHFYVCIKFGDFVFYTSPTCLCTCIFSSFSLGAVLVHKATQLSVFYLHKYYVPLQDS